MQSEEHRVLHFLQSLMMHWYFDCRHGVIISNLSLGLVALSWMFFYATVRQR